MTLSLALTLALTLALALALALALTLTVALTLTLTLLILQMHKLFPSSNKLECTCATEGSSPRLRDPGQACYSHV